MIMLKDMLRLLRDSDKIMIEQGQKKLYIGYKYGLENCEHSEEMMKKKIVYFQVVTDIKHRDWKKLGLMQPLDPAEIPQYRFRDLQLTFYYEIRLQEEKQTVNSESKNE